MNKFIEFTSIYTGKAMQINIDEISSFYEDSVKLPNTSSLRNCTSIYMKNGNHHTVRENYNEVKEKINENNR